MKTTILINPKYEELYKWLEEMPAKFSDEGREIYKLRNIIKVMDAPEGLLLNVKRYHKPHFPNSLIYSLGIRKAKGKRAFEHPVLLADAGIDTPEPVAYIEQRTAGILGFSFFVSIHRQNCHTMYEVAGKDDDEYAELMEALGCFTARLHDARILHCDYTPGNILWNKNDDGTFCFSLVDTNRMRFGEVGMHEGCRNMKKMWGSRRLVGIMVRSYARARGFDEDACEKETMALRRTFWKNYKDKDKLPFKIDV
ncbi:lipopolysaccharide kinase InaA family protein [Prevotella sp. OH937_COT-195]|uniref:lipopolysaccharide kinase InaA family protein n=1 Tax=Prevotella sp. OH937_COT-195 TaxID=2491051 RepID=UPI001315246C|nr:lipopolysaccharide kinase InaA family protein [Prevotella sp. OH937_COT-195]